MNVTDVIATKRDGGELGDEQIDWVIGAYVRGEVAAEQMAALAMAIYLRGMSGRETVAWTDAMVRSGERMDWSGVPKPTADKHSTGGVGDKITLPLGPAVAACGVAVPQLSGRGLGHTGGTLDKLESIPGWRAGLTAAQMREQLAGVGAFVAAAAEFIAPADRELYALRDVTGTVASMPLIASSIMSKKIAEGTAALVLDVKVGSGAFMTSAADARALASTMVELGTAHGVRTTALLTGMDVPLGRAAGNAVEVAEAVEVLAGGGPADVVDLTVALGREMVSSAGSRNGKDPADALRDGSAMDAWRAMVAAQGGDPDASLPAADETYDVPATETGTLTWLDARAIGVAAWRLGAGRARKEDAVSAAAGVLLRRRPGDRVRAGEPILTLRADEAGRFAAAAEALRDAIEVDGPRTPQPLFVDRVPGRPG